MAENYLAEFQPDGSVLMLSMRRNGSTVRKLSDHQPLEARLMRYPALGLEGDELGNVKMDLKYDSSLSNPRGWESLWEPREASYWTGAHTLHVSVGDEVYRALEQEGKYVLEGVWENRQK